MSHFPDLLIIGAGITGLALAFKAKTRWPDLKISLIEKESDVAQHASGRNSGVLHAGFYYSSNSLKARLCRQGNLAMQAFCLEHGLKLNPCGKLVLTKNEAELPALHRLYQQGLKNGIPLQLLTEDQVRELEPEAATCQAALYSPSTASVDPLEICQFLKQRLQTLGVHFYFETRYLRQRRSQVFSNRGCFEAGHVINCAGLYADKIAQDYGFGKTYTLLPFKGLYLSFEGDPQLLSHHLYPVPDPRQPFLGVHYTRTVHQQLKIGPTAIPALWRENYGGLSRFKLAELLEVLWYEGQLFASNRFGFRELALSEIRKYWRPEFARQAAHLTQTEHTTEFGKFLRPGIRAQLLDTRRMELVKDFVIEGDQSSTHVLNAVSPAFTCAFAFADYILEQTPLQQQPHSRGMNSPLPLKPLL